MSEPTNPEVVILNVALELPLAQRGIHQVGTNAALACGSIDGRLHVASGTNRYRVTIKQNDCHLGKRFQNRGLLSFLSEVVNG